MKRKGILDLDKKDKELLYLLDVNCRMTYSQMAKKLKISKQVVKYRVERLEKEGFIRGYFPMIDLSRLGIISFRVYLKLKGINSNQKSQIIEYLKKQKQVWALVHISGKWDIVLGIGVKHILGFYYFWDNLLKKFLSRIQDYKISIYAPIYHYSQAYLIDKEDTSKIRILGGGEKEDFDEKDLNILLELSNNAKISLVDLSKKINLTAEAINYRIKQLEKKGILQGYRASINVEKLGYLFYKTEIRLKSFEKIDSLLDFCHRHPNIYQVDKTIGGETIEIEFHVKSVNELNKIIDEIEKNFPGIIDYYDYLTIQGFEKITFMPNILEISRN